MERRRARSAERRRPASELAGPAAEDATQRGPDAARRRLAFLAEASALLAASLDYETTPSNVARLCVPSLADYCLVYLLGADGRLRQAAAVHQDPKKESLARELAEIYQPEPSNPASRVGEVLRSGRASIGIATDTPPAELLDQAPRLLELHRRLRPRSYILAPLAARGETLGVLVLVQAESGRIYGPEDLELAEDVARLAALAVDNARLFQHARGAEQEARALYQATLAIISEPNLETRLERILDVMLELLRTPYGHIALVDPVRQDIELVAARGNRSQVVGLRIPPGAGLLGAVIASNRPLRVVDATRDARVYLLQSVEQEDMRAWLGVPLADAGGAFGALVTSARRPGLFGDEEERRLVSLATLVSAAVREARLHRDLEHAIRMREEFLSAAAHELKTPVTSMRGFSQLAVRQIDLQGQINPAIVRQALRVIDQQSERLTRLVAQLLDVTSLDAGKLALSRAPTDLSQLVHGVIASVATRAGSQQLEVRASPGLVASVDPLRMEQVLSNLLDNALRFNPNERPIELELALAHSTMARISVRDHGVGIPPAEHDRIFERYYQSSESGRGGLGLGLFVSRKIVELHGGRLDMESPADGGARFVIHLPILAPRELLREPAS